MNGSRANGSALAAVAEAFFAGLLFYSWMKSFFLLAPLGPILNRAGTAAEKVLAWFLFGGPLVEISFAVAILLYLSRRRKRATEHFDAHGETAETESKR
jgi:hypothetical protein